MSEIKLSEAIRKGSAMKPQAFREACNNTESCALQAACDGLGIDVNEWSRLEFRYPFLRRIVSCPECNEEHEEGKVIQVIYHLNDTHHWTREAIADWVESIEAAQPVEKREEVGA